MEAVNLKSRVRIPPARVLGFLRGLLRSEDVPEEWWGSWVFQRATESLRGWDCGGIVSSFVLQIIAERVDNATLQFNCSLFMPRQSNFLT